MKRLRSSEDLEDLASNRLSSHRNNYYKSENGRPRYDRVVEDERESSRLARKRPEHDYEGSDRRKVFDRFRNGCDGRGGGLASSSRGIYGAADRIHRSESFSVSRREFPKGYRSERDRSRREGSVSSWRKFGGNKEFEDASRNASDLGRVSRDRGLAKSTSSKGFRDGNLILKSPTLGPNLTPKSPTLSKESGSEQSTRIRLSPKGTGDGKSKLKSPSWSRESESEQSRIRSPKGLADGKAKSPTWSKESETEQSKRRSPKGLGDGNIKSPLWSKDSWSEQLKSVRSKKNEDLLVQSSSSGEREEGELEPETEVQQAQDEAETVPFPETKIEAPDDILKLDLADMENEKQLKDTVTKHGAEAVGKDEVEQNKHSIFNRDITEKGICNLPDSQDSSICETSVHGEAIQVTGENEGDEKYRECIEFKEELKKEMGSEHLEPSWNGLKEGIADIHLTGSGNEDVEGHGVSNKNFPSSMEALITNCTDKGKRLAATSTYISNSLEDGTWIKRGSRKEFLNCRDDNRSGPSTKGFELFSKSPVRKTDKVDQSCANNYEEEKLPQESLNLSLSLPNTLFPIGSLDLAQDPASPSQARSVHSLTNTFNTNSDGFTASMSFTGSQFVHNPSCSLRQNSFDNYEQSVGSRPLFQGVDLGSHGSWQGGTLEEPKQKESPMYQRILMTGNESILYPPALRGTSSNQQMLGQQFRNLEGNYKVSIGLDRQLSFQKPLSAVQRWHDNDTKSASPNSGSHATTSDFCKEKKRPTERSGSWYRSTSLKEQNQQQMNGSEIIETVIARLVSEPFRVVSRRFHDMPEQSIVLLKEGIYNILSDADKCEQLCAIQKAMQNMSDVTLEMLSKSHRTQLEIMVALRTGQKEYLQQNRSISAPDLAEIFLNLKCKNLSCRGSLPVDECDCKICSQKSGFCSACMCLVCSKFDMASNTCSWVGCDVCLHWCHTNCALRESYIRNGQSVNGSEETTEMQFFCVACNHPSEMFGFVKEVFLNFAKDWNAGTFFKELEYIKRIFQASCDIRGKQLHDISDQMLATLSNKSDLSGVYQRIMGFLTGSDYSKSEKTAGISKDAHDTKPGEVNCGTARPSQEALRDRTGELDKSASFRPYFDGKQKDKHDTETERQLTDPKVSVFEELESIIKIKRAEAKMFQTRADDARREGECLKRIAVAKNQKNEEEYKNRIAKLRLAEAEEMREQKREELQALERAHREYFGMKLRMEAEMKNLLVKMEATRRNLAM